MTFSHDGFNGEHSIQSFAFMVIKQKQRNVYLPSTAWYDFWIGKQFTGVQTVETQAPQDKIPLFVKAGSIIPMGKFLQYTSEKPTDTVEIRIYAGADGQFALYDDEGG